jgi:hypothetical protein
LVIEGAIGDIVRDFAHTLRINRHGLVCLLGHAEDLAHLRWRWGGAVDASDAALLLDPVLLSQLLEVRVLQGLGGRHPMVVVVYQQFLYDFASVLVLRDHLLEASSLFLREVKLHVTCHFLKLIQ